MVVKFNSLNRLEKPQFTLCNPGSVYSGGAPTSIVGILTAHEAEEILFNFNALSELNFRLNRVTVEDPDMNEHLYRMYKAVQNRRMIFIDGIGYFCITNVVDGYMDGVHFKDITAQSVDVEIQQKMIPYIPNGTYRFSTDETGTNTGILETIVSVLPLWTIGYVEDTVAQKWRTFEDVDVSMNCLGFLLDSVQNAYECIILFDIINRQINVYDQNNYVRRTSVHLSKDDVINALDVIENAEDIYTAITVKGDEDLTIAAINPLGTSTIYNFDYYLSWMSDALSAKVSAWQQALSDAQAQYYADNLAYYSKLGEAYTYEAEVNRLNTQITMYQRCRDNIVAESGTSLVADYNEAIVEAGGVAIIVYEDITATLAEIDDMLAVCQSHLSAAEAELYNINSEIATLQTLINQVRSTLSVTSYFSQEEYDELSHYIFEGAYTDEYVLITDNMSYNEQFAQMKILYDRAESRLSIVSQPKQQFEVNVENFIFAKEFEHWSEQLETGCLINVEIEQGDVAALFLTNITINYDDHNLTMTFGNRFNRFDTKALFDDVLGNISKSANTLNYMKELLYPIRNGEFSAMQEAIQSSRDLTMAGALASTGEEVVIDGSGYTGRKRMSNGEFDPRQIKITGQNIVFTDDAWQSCRTAVGELLLGNGESSYGINAETIIGNLIMGHTLKIVDNEGNELLSVVDDRISTAVGAVGDRITTLEQTANGLLIRVTNVETAVDEIDHVTTSTGYTFDANGLRITRTGEDIVNLLDNTGMYVRRVSGDGTEEAILTANTDGVSAINLSSSQFLIVGANCRFEDYDNGVDHNRTACFYIGT